MGSCLCKEEATNGSSSNSRQNDGASENICNSDRCANNIKTLSETVDKLVNETLEVIGSIIDNESDPPNSILRLHLITDKPAGWIELVRSLMRVVPIEHPMGPSVIALLLDDSPLPTRESILKVGDMITSSLRRNLRKERNLCVILGCLAEKLAGPNSIALLNDTTLTYLISNLEDDIDANIKLLSLIALEKFAQTSENKATIRRALGKLDKNPLVTLEQYATSKDYLLRQIGFCARWCLDNYFLIEKRNYSYETADVDNINVMLNTNDVSEYLKISPEGLEARSDAFTFESVRCTFQVSEGCWYYEVTLITPGVMQIGWATKESNFLSDDGYGIGDDKYSMGFDGCRRLIWHNAKSTPHSLTVWKSGSVLGCLLDCDKLEVVFSLNGETTEPLRHIFNNVRKGFFAAASFMSFQQCRFNFGLEAFRFPPKRSHQSFNEFGNLENKDKVVLPRHLYLELLRKVSVNEDSCTLCFDQKATIVLKPCQHRGFCEICAQQLKYCPMCRGEIKEKAEHVSIENLATTEEEISTQPILSNPT